MLKYVKAAVLAAAVVLLTGVLAQPARAEVSFDFAYSNLSQHGSWLVSGQYGRVWQPREYNPEWSPYYDGHWVYTDMGWTWVSDYEWGSIPYHYGTWVNDPYNGWVWIPGRVWAPAWVVFRTGPDYIGWAPVPPGFSVGMSIDMGGPSSFVFVSSRDFLAPRLRGSIIPRERAVVFMNNTTVVNNIVIQNNVVINRGPDFRTVEKATGRTIREERIESVARVAPFAHLSRAQLAVDPETAKHGVRVADPVPESRPLPVSGERGRPNNQGQAKSPVVAPTRENAPSGHAAQPPPHREATPVTPSKQAAARVQARDAQQRSNQQAAADVQKARPAPAPTRAGAAASSTEARDKANAQQPVKAQADAKSKKAKKANPDDKKPNSDKGNSQEPKE